MIYPVDRAIHLLNKPGPLIYSMVWPFKLKVVVGWRRQYLYSLALVFFFFFFTMDLNFDVKNKWAVIAWINPWRSIFSFLRFDDWKLAITNAEAKTWGEPPSTDKTLPCPPIVRVKRGTVEHFYEHFIRLLYMDDKYIFWNQDHGGEKGKTETFSLSLLWESFYHVQYF